MVTRHRQAALQSARPSLKSCCNIKPSAASKARKPNSPKLLQWWLLLLGPPTSNAYHARAFSLRKGYGKRLAVTITASRVSSTFTARQ